MPAVASVLVKAARALREGTFPEKARATRAAAIREHGLNWWPLLGLPPSRVGAGPGALNAMRDWHYRHRRRPCHIALIDLGPTAVRFGALTCHWVNRRSRLFSASMNGDLERADVVWVHCQDPLTDLVRDHVLRLIERAPPGALVLNHPDHYNAYHEPDAFDRLAAAGVSVPRSRFGREDVGKVRVVVKRTGTQGAQKYAEPYRGDVAGHRAFEFIDARGADGRYRRYRAFYVAGAVRPSKLMRCEDWNVCLANRPLLEYAFEMTAAEIRQVRLIARTLGLDYFAVDYLRRRGDDRPFFTDVNVYPTNFSLRRTQRLAGDCGRWHTFDTRARLGVPEPGGRPFAEVFDDVLERRLRGDPVPWTASTYDGR